MPGGGRLLFEALVHIGIPAAACSGPAAHVTKEVLHGMMHHGFEPGAESSSLREKRRGAEGPGAFLDQEDSWPLLLWILWCVPPNQRLPRAAALA